MTKLIGTVVSSMLLASTLVSCNLKSQPMGIKMRKKTQLEVEWVRYRDLPGHKSFAVAGDPVGEFATGYAYGHPNPQAAVDQALDFCEERRSDRRIQNECEIWSVDDEHVRKPDL